MHYKDLGPVIVDIKGGELKQDEKELLQHPQVGGLILFSRNYESPHQLRGLVREAREKRPDLLLCVDHEGGRVQRFRQGFTVLPAMQRLGRQYLVSPVQAAQQAQELGWLMAAELIDVDIDLSFAPVLDVDDDLSDIIGDRAFSADPETVTVLAGAFIAGMKEAGMAATGKHFPGHGGIKQDSHLELPVDTRPWQAVFARDLLPFRRLADQLDALMSAHIVFPEVDSELVSFSSYWLHRYARRELGFKGLIFSDDLSMEGAAGGGSFFDRAICALRAGCDAVLVCNRPDGAIAVIEGLEKTTSTVMANEPRISLSVLRQRAPSQALPSPLTKSSRWQQAHRLAEQLRFE